AYLSSVTVMASVCPTAPPSAPWSIRLVPRKPPSPNSGPAPTRGAGCGHLGRGRKAKAPDERKPMLIERVFDPDLAHASYVIGCQAAGTAIVIDPRRDIQPYLDIAAKNSMQITAVTETHIHADYVSGARELA